MANSAIRRVAAAAAVWGIAIPALGIAASSAPCADPEPPAGAQSLGYVHRLFCVAPSIKDISGSAAAPNAKLSTWIWYSSKPSPMSMYSMEGNALVIANGGGLNTQTHQSMPAALPLLTASSGFYVEFAEHLSDNDPDHFPAVWLMPQEHNGHHTDHVPGDPADYERWMELDVDEGGFNAGHHGAMINWYGIYPQYQHQNSGNDPTATFGLDRTKEHVFGLSYDPAGKKVTWWVDDVNVGSVSTAHVPALVNTHHYYLIMGAQNHKLNKPYKMYLTYFSAWSPQTVPNPPSGVAGKVQ